MASKKSSDVIFLGKHTLIIFISFLAGMGAFGVYDPKVSIYGGNVSLSNALQFCFYNSMIHAFIDGSIWNLYKKIVICKIKKHIDSYYKDGFKLDEKEFNERVEYDVKTYEFWKDGMFFDTIGLDQFLHVSTIIILCEIFLK
jgi:hypothetical protein